MAQGSTCHVLVEDPDLGEALDRARQESASRECVARVIEISTGAWQPYEVEGMRHGMGLLILDGMLVRHVGVGGRSGAELLGEGDLMRPWQNDEGHPTLPRAGRWRVLRECRLAVLDGDFTQRVCRYPEVIAALFMRGLRRSRHIAVNMAIVQQPRIDIRLHMLFWELADRWGRVRQDGVHVPIQVTHATLADLVAARRPTVTKALGELAERGALVWTGEDWVLPGDPPADLEALVTLSKNGTGARRASAS